MDLMQQQQLLLANKESIKITLTKIKSALQRIKDSTYGNCLTCEEEISEKRLKANPEVLNCTDCQEKISN